MGNSINTISKIADDVFDSNLNFCIDHKNVGEKGIEMKAAVVRDTGAIIHKQGWLKDVTTGTRCRVTDSCRNDNIAFHTKIIAGHNGTFPPILVMPL